MCCAETLHAAQCAGGRIPAWESFLAGPPVLPMPAQNSTQSLHIHCFVSPQVSLKVQYVIALVTHIFHPNHVLASLKAGRFSSTHLHVSLPSATPDSLSEYF